VTLRLKLPGTEPSWIEILIGDQRARFLCAPFTAELEYTAIWEARDRMAALVKEGGRSPAEQAAIAHVHGIKALARRVITDWEGLEDEATGEPIGLNPATLDLVFSVREIARAFDRAYTASTGIGLAEKNGFRPAAAGTPAAGPTTAPAASPASANGAATAST